MLLSQIYVESGPTLVKVFKQDSKYYIRHTTYGKGAAEHYVYENERLYFIPPLMDVKYKDKIKEILVDGKIIHGYNIDLLKKMFGLKYDSEPSPDK